MSYRDGRQLRGLPDTFLEPLIQSHRFDQYIIMPFCCKSRPFIAALFCSVIAPRCDMGEGVN